jgi:putative N6-adenine-specific DNA methylase
LEESANIFVTCAPKISEILETEIQDLGYSNTILQPKGVLLKGTLTDCMKLNLYLRTANKVLWEATSFKARAPEQMYRQANKFRWEKYISADEYISIDSFVKNDAILDTRFANLKFKDAVVDRLNQVLDERPDSGPNKANVCLFIHWLAEDCTLYFDTSGETISKHGYRKIPGSAPLMETLAAALILKSRWDKKVPFVNPMCGSGTLAIEAALLATNTAPGLFRSNFGFMHLLTYNETIWHKLVDEARNQIQDFTGTIIASDISTNAVKITATNVKTAGMEQYIHIQQCDFRGTDVPEGPGVVMMNPEYGERLGDEDKLKDTYRAIGDFFKQHCQGYWGYIFTGNTVLAKHVGLRTKRKIEFYNAQIECRLLEYELYAGSKKPK